MKISWIYDSNFRLTKKLGILKFLTQMSQSLKHLSIYKYFAWTILAQKNSYLNQKVLKPPVLFKTIKIVYLKH